jgi:hypothetical protein
LRKTAADGGEQAWKQHGWTLAFGMEFGTSKGYIVHT